MSTPDKTSRVLVYRLSEPKELEERDAALAQYLSAPGPGAPLEPWFESLPGGCFRWEDFGRLGRDRPGGALPGGAAEARRAAAAYMKAANEAANRSRAARGLDRNRHPDPFPIESLQPTSVRRVRSRQTGRDDHWLTIWTTALPATPRTEGGRSLVLGSTVELRVGEGRRVIGVVSRARPWSAVAIRPALRHSEDGDHAHGGGAGSEMEPALVYLLDNPFEPQRFLAPCWLIEPEDQESHHARRLWPASDHTVLPEMAVEERDGEATVTALVLTEGRRAARTEHGEEWRVRWSVANLGKFLAGERRVSASSSTSLPGPGIYQVELELEHAPTGAVRSTHSRIAVAPRQSEKRDPHTFIQS